MKLTYKFAALTLMLCAVSANSFAVTTNNLARGVIGTITSNVSWTNYSVLSFIPGSGLFSFASSTTVFYMGFTAGTSADITNMVVYTTARGSKTITAVTPVTYSGSSNPTINIGSTSICPQGVSTASPCIVRFDPTSLSLSPASDYYFVVHFATDTNNQTLGATQAGVGQSSIGGAYFGSIDYTQFTVGQTFPNGPNSGPSFLMYVMNN
jgi:hypothetical protein